MYSMHLSKRFFHNVSGNAAPVQIRHADADLRACFIEIYSAKYLTVSCSVWLFTSFSDIVFSLF